MSKSKITFLETGETLDAVDQVCFVDIQNTLATSGDEYHVLLLTTSGLEKLSTATCKPAVLEWLTNALGEKDSIHLGYQTIRDETKWTITGQARNRADSPIPGLRVLAYDKDTAKADDFLGCAFADNEGRFEIGYDEADFKSEKSFIDFEGNPDIYLEIMEIPSGRSKRTFTKGEAEQAEHFELKIDLNSKTKTLRSVVGYYFIEEDTLEKELEELKERVTKDHKDTEAHFLLGLCLIEKIKLDLRKSEWVLADVRSNDDVLAVSAINAFNQVAVLDPDREDEAKRYREYIQKLQNLAL